MAKQMVVDKVPVELHEAVLKAWRERKSGGEPELKKWQVYSELTVKVKGVKK